MAYLKTNYHILSWEEFLKRKKNGGKVPRNSVLITFDDGYKDFYIYAYPTLKELQIPVIIFITTDAIETGDYLFFDALRFGIMNTKRKILDLGDFVGKEYVLWPNELHLSRVIKEIVSFSKQLSHGEKLRLIEAIHERLGINKELFGKKQIYLSWREIHQMSRDGITFGSHTKTHPSIKFLSEEEAYNEILGSKKMLEEKIGKEVETFAYPFGGLNDYSPVSEKILKENGFKCAFLLGETERDDFLIGRKVVDSHMTEDLRGGFEKRVFDCDISLR
jgi:peptidoglycan/xylan/chitin deacetylase (PgdA/CDA1 family)